MKEKQNKEQDEQEPVNQQELNDTLQELLKQNFPKGTKANFTAALSTQQIFIRVKSIYPYELTSHDVYDALKSMGYVFADVGGELQWLLIENMPVELSF